MTRRVSKIINDDVSTSANQDTVRKITYTKLHAHLGHPGPDRIRATARKLGFKGTGRADSCVDCAEAKAKQKSVSKTTETKSTTKGDHMYLDISSVKELSTGGAKYWALIVDEATDMCWSLFLQTKKTSRTKG